MKKYINQLKLILIITVIYLLVVGILATKDNSLLFYGDQTQQVIQIYTHVYNLIRSGQLSLWDTSIGLGSSILSHYWTVLGSFSFYIYLLLPKGEYIIYFFALINWLRSILLGLLGYYYLHKYIKVKDIYCLIGALLFSFNSFTIYFVHYPYFGDFMVYTLLLMISSECAFKKNNYIYFIIVIALCSISNLYNVYMNIFFMFIYLNVRIFMLYKDINIKIYLKWFICFFISILLGLGLSSIILFSNIETVLLNNRIGNNNLSLFKTLKDIYAIITSYISPVINDYDYNIYTNYFSDNITTYIPYVYSSILFIYSLFISYKEKYNGKKEILIAILTITILMFSPYTNLILNGNDSARFGYYIAYLAIIFTCITLDNINICKKKALISLILTSVVLMIFGCISIMFKLNSNDNTVNIIINTFILTVICLIFTVGITINKKAILLLSVAIEMLYCFGSRYYNNLAIQSESNQNWYKYQTLLYDSDSLDYIDNNCDTNGFYRIDRVKNDFTNYNDALMFNYSGYNLYLSSYNFNTLPYSEKHFSDNQFINTNGSKYIVKQLSGLRYQIIYDDNDFVSDDMQLVDTVNNQSIYINTNQTGLGYSISNAIGQNNINNLSVYNQDQLMQHYAILDESNDSYDSTLISNNTALDNNYLDLTDITGYIVIDYSLRNNYCHSAIEFYNADGESIKYIEKDEYAYTIVKIPDDATGAYIYVTNQFNSNEYIDANIYLINDTKLDDSDILTRFTNVVVDKDYYSGDIEILNDNDYVITSIAYDDGWKVYDNGELINTYRVNNGFIGFNLDSGSHNIVMKYNPIKPYQIVIMGISIIGTIIFNLYIDKKINYH